MIAVTVIFYGAAAVIRDVLIRFRHNQLHTETEHIRYFRFLIGYHFLIHFYATFIIDSISEIQFGRNTLHVIFSGNNYLFIFRFVLQRNKPDVWILPDYILLLQFCTIVIVSWSTPEVRRKCGAFLNQIHAVNGVAIHISGRFAEPDKKIFSFYKKVADILVINLWDNCRCIIINDIFQVHCRSFICIHH